MTPIVRPASGELITSAWGQTVADAVNGIHVYRSVIAAKVTVPNGSAQTVVTLVTPVVPVGMTALATMTLLYSQTATGAFDTQFLIPVSQTFVHQGTDGLAATKIATFTATVLGAGAAMTWSILVNAWGGQAVSANLGSNISCLVVPS